MPTLIAYSEPHRPALNCRVIDRRALTFRSGRLTARMHVRLAVEHLCTQSRVVHVVD